MKLSDYTKSLLSDIEERIDPEVEEDYLLQWKKFWDGENSDAIFTPERKKTSLPKIEIKGVHINDAIDDLELMLMAQLAGVSRALSTKTEALALRANYGTGIMTSLFGAELFMAFACLFSTEKAGKGVVIHTDGIIFYLFSDGLIFDYYVLFDKTLIDE
jgi:hypothetical protein